jgi:hypothetical protein
MIARARRRSLPRSAIAALTLVSLILVGYLILVLKWEDFADYDDFGTGHVLRLFFPFSSDYVVTEFASYLIYRGVWVEGEGTAVNPSAPRGVIVSKSFAIDGPCVDYQKFVCHAGGKPVSGDLVIELPDDPESQAEVEPYRAGGVLLLAYEPGPRIPRWTFPLLSRLHAPSLQRWFMDLPDRWLHASITKWK